MCPVDDPQSQHIPSHQFGNLKQELEPSLRPDRTLNLNHLHEPSWKLNSDNELADVDKVAVLNREDIAVAQQEVKGSSRAMAAVSPSGGHRMQNEISEDRSELQRSFSNWRRICPQRWR